MKISIKTTYLLMVAVIALLGIVIVPTYAKFVHTETINDNNDIVKINLDFDIEISSIDQYEEITVKSGHSVEFNVDVFNNTDSNLYYGIWYKMIYPNTLPDSGVIQIGKIENTTTSTIGTVETKNNITASIGVINNTNDDIKIYIGVNSSTTSTSDIEYLDGKTLITGEVQELSDINIASVTIDGVLNSGLPSSGYYDMTYECVKGSTLRWDSLKRTLTYASGSYAKDVCDLTFTSSTEYPLLNEMEVGSYVAYEGKGGTVGNTTVNCQLNGNASSSTAADETEAPNSCLGQNAREDLDTSGYTYGYCYNPNYKYYTTGWRIAYVDNNNKPVIVSAGSPECNRTIFSNNNETYIKMANTKAMKYCNSDLVDGNCNCSDSNSDGYCDCTDSDDDGLCDEIENGIVDAWSISDIDLYNITKSISGYGKRASLDSSELGDSGGSLGTTLYCDRKYSYKECGYNNDLLVNGGFYWLAVRYIKSMNFMPYWKNTVDYYSTNNGYTYGLRPVIKLSASVVVTGGTGIIDDPYIISNPI